MGITRLQLEVETEAGDPIARKVLHHRKDTNRLLATILWGNVGVNTLLAQLTGDALTGFIGFLVSTVLITIVGEILPQAYMNKNLKKVYKFLDPLVYLYWYLLTPIAWPTGKIIDKLVGKDGLTYFKENEMRHLLKYHASDTKSEISPTEATGAMNFLKLDDTLVRQEGKIIDPDSIITVDTGGNGHIALPDKIRRGDEFVRKVLAAGQPWVILTGTEGTPLLALDADEFLREILHDGSARLYYHCHRPIVVNSPDATLEESLTRFAVDKIHGQDDVIDDDVILYWTGTEKRILTGADLLGFLLRGISQRIQP